MLRKINEGGVASDDGFSIQIIGPEILEYSCNDNILRIDIGYDPRKRVVYIYANDIIQWSYSGKKSSISGKEKNEIIKNIRAAVELLSGKFEIA